MRTLNRVRWLTVPIAFAAITGLAACEEKSDTEEAVEELGDEIEDAGDEIEDEIDDNT